LAFHGACTKLTEYGPQPVSDFRLRFN